MVLAYPPQRMSGSISANSNYTPQGQISVSQFDTMQYEDLNTMAYTPDWFSLLWQKRIQLTINSGQVPSTQLDFPLLINDTYPDLIGEGEGEEEFRFTGIDNVQLDYEIQEFNDITGKLIAWVKKPTVSDGDVINIYFDNSAASNEQNAAAVWSDYNAVLHMTSVMIDSTGNNAVVNTGTVDAVGQIGRARLFDGTSNFLDLGNFDLTGTQFTLSAWVQPTFIPGNNTVIGKSDSAMDVTPFYKWLLCVTSNKAVLGRKDITEVQTIIGVIPAGIFSLIHCVYDGTNIKVCINGTFNAQMSVTTPIESSSQNVRIGASGTTIPVDFYGGRIDESHIQNISRDDDWITTEFNNQVNQSTFYSTGTVESVPTLDIMGYEKRQ